MDHDIFKALGEAKTYYQIEVIRVNLSAPGELIETLKALDRNDYDLIAIARGGGEGLDFFNHSQLLKVVAGLQKPVVVAIGHTKDHPLIELVADKYLPTPTYLGNWLKELVEEVKEKKTLNNLLKPTKNK